MSNLSPRALALYQAHGPGPVDWERMAEIAAVLPPIGTLQDWHVGKMRDSMNEVRFVLVSNDEARAWAVWIAGQDEVAPPADAETSEEAARG